MSSEILQFVTQYSLYTGCILFSLGVIGNTLNILIFTKLKLFQHSRCAFYLTIESISSLLYQFIYITVAISISLHGDDGTGRSIVWCKLRYILSVIFALITSYTICLAAADQFFSTNYRYNLRHMCTSKLARCLTVALACLTIIHSTAFGFSVTIQSPVGCVISNPVWLQYATYFFYPVLAGLLPVTIASFFSILAYRNVRHIIRRQIPIVRRRLDQQITAMVLMRVILFVCFATPYISYRVYVISFPVSRTKPMEYAIIRLVDAISYTFFILHYAASFYLFVISSSRFRRQVKFVLIKKYWKQWKSLFCFRDNEVAPETAESRVANMELEDID